MRKKLSNLVRGFGKGYLQDDKTENVKTTQEILGWDHNQITS